MERMAFEPDDESEDLQKVAKSEPIVRSLAHDSSDDEQPRGLVDSGDA